VTLCGILLFPGVLQFAEKQTRRADAAWGTAPLKSDRTRVDQLYSPEGRKTEEKTHTHKLN